MLISEICSENKFDGILADYLSFIKNNHNLKDIQDYYKEKNLKIYADKWYNGNHQTEYVYVLFNTLKTKYYIGETANCFTRIKNYFDRTSISNRELKEDIKDTSIFQYWLTTTDDCKWLEAKKIQDANARGLWLYNTIQTSPLKVSKKVHQIAKKTIKMQPDDFKGFGDLFL